MKSAKYLDELLRRKSFPDFLKAMNYHVDTKEWTECMGMLRRVVHVMKTFPDKNIEEPVLLYDIGCGKRPTLGTLVALNLHSVGSVYAIDPQLDVSYGKEIANLYFFTRTIDSFLREFVSDIKREVLWDFPAIVCNNHGHAKLHEVKALLSTHKNWRYITCPCCIDNRLHHGEYFRDKYVWSPKNEFYIYKSEDYKNKEDE